MHLPNIVQQPYPQQNFVDVKHSDIVNSDEMNTVKCISISGYPGYFVTDSPTILSSSKHAPQALLFHSLFLISIHLSVPCSAICTVPLSPAPEDAATKQESVCQLYHSTV